MGEPIAKLAREPHGAAQLSQHQGSKLERRVRLVICDQNPTTSVSNFLTSCSENKVHAEQMLAGCATYMVRKIIDSLCVETLSIELGKGSSNVVESACGFLHGGLLNKNNRTGVAVTLNVKMSTEATECRFDVVEQLLVLAGCPPHLDFKGLELKVDSSGGSRDQSKRA